eukprot:251481-Prymnesium_polylepis.1
MSRSVCSRISRILRHGDRCVKMTRGEGWDAVLGEQVPSLGCVVCFLTGVIYYWQPGKQPGNLLATWQPAGNRRC